MLCYCWSFWCSQLLTSKNIKKIKKNLKKKIVLSILLLAAWIWLLCIVCSNAYITFNMRKMELEVCFVKCLRIFCLCSQGSLWLLCWLLLRSDGKLSTKIPKKLNKKYSGFICSHLLWLPMMILSLANGLNNIQLIFSISCRVKYNGLFISRNFLNISFLCLLYGGAKELHKKNWMNSNKR